ncbi:MAG: hypothetical protein KatS3mg102_1202 [Planctomycetota bacterium]|nr:MAG: hypothetical protein KatS3mg102_1202 [Planctomycetota bacterium]
MRARSLARGHLVARARSCSRALGALLRVGALLALPGALPAAGAAEPLLDVPGYEALTSSAEARGDLDGFVAQLTAVIAERPGSQAGALALARLAEVRRQAPRGSAIARPVLERLFAERAFAGAGSEPALRTANLDRALALLAALRAEAGDWQGAAAVQQQRGVVRHWLLAGPFGLSGQGAHRRPFAPEQLLAQPAALAAAEPLPPGGGPPRPPRRWRAFRVPAAESVLRFGHRVQPARGVVYALAQLRAAPGAQAWVSAGSSGSYKVWWNGERIADVDRGAGYAPEEVRFPVRFGEGWQRVLIKCGGGEVSLRLLAADGSGPPPEFEVLASEQIAPSGQAELGVPLPAVADPGAEAVPPLERAARGWLLAEAGVVPAGLAALQAAAQQLPASAHLQMHLARLYERAPHYPRERARNEARRHWRRALQLDPDLVPARLWQARALDEDGKPVEAFRALHALGAQAGLGQAHAAAAAIARREGWEQQAREELLAWAALAPGDPEPLLELAELERELGAAQREEQLLRAAAALDATRLEAEERLAELAIARGAAAQAVAIQQRLLARTPDDPWRLRQLADALLAAGEPERAAALLVEAAEHAGGDALAFEAAGRLWLERWAELSAGPDGSLRWPPLPAPPGASGGAGSGGTAPAAGEGGPAAARAALGEGERALQRALALAPHRYELRRLLAELGAGTDPDEELRALWIPFEQVLGAAPPPERWPDAHSVALLDHMITRLYPDASRVDTVHQIFRIQDAKGVERHHTLQVPGEVLVLRTVAPEGNSYEPVRVAGSPEVLMPKLAPGAVIELAYRVVHPAPPVQLDTGRFYLSDPELEEPFALSRWDVIAPAELALERMERNLPTPAAVQVRGDGTVHLRWEQRLSERVRPEPLMPPPDEIVPWVRLLSPLELEDVAEVYAERLAGLARPNPELEAAARAAIAGREGALAQAQALYELVCERVRRPGPDWEASRVWAEGAGARLPLLLALCRAAGLPAHLAVTGPNPALVPPLDWTPPRPELFEAGLLVYLPLGEDSGVWVADAGRLAAFGTVPLQLAGATALVLQPDGAVLRVVPPLGPEAVRVETELEVRLVGTDAEFALSTVLHGVQGYALKERVAMSPEPMLRGFVETQAAQLFHGARLQEFDFPGLQARGEPFRLRYRARAPRAVSELGGAPAVASGLVPLRLVRTFGGVSERRQPLALRLVQMQRDRVRIVLEPGWALARAPEPLLVRTAIGSYTLRVSAGRDEVQLERVVIIEPAVLSPAEVGPLLEQLRRIEEAEAQRVVLRRVR